MEGRGEDTGGLRAVDEMGWSPEFFADIFDHGQKGKEERLLGSRVETVEWPLGVGSWKLGPFRGSCSLECPYRASSQAESAAAAALQKVPESQCLPSSGTFPPEAAANGLSSHSELLEKPLIKHWGGEH